jgi:hypothetical protein
VPGTFDKVCQVPIGKVDEMPLHILTSEIYEGLPDEIPDPARARVQHDPDGLLGVETDLDEVIATAKRT